MATLGPTQAYELVVRSTIIQSEKPGKALEGVLAPNPNQMNRVTGFLPDGRKVVVAQRHGTGGMDFNKIVSGKVFAVAADGFSPVYEKGEDKKPTKVQKTENGLPLFSSSGFYLLSSKEYPALRIFPAFTRLGEQGEQVLLLTAAQLRARKRARITTEERFQEVMSEWCQLLDDEHNLMTEFDAAANKKRKLAITLAQTTAEAQLDDGGEPYSGVEFSELKVSKKDGNPFLLLVWRIGDEPPTEAHVLREMPGVSETSDHPITEYLSSDEALSQFMAGPIGKRMVAALRAGQSVSVAYAQGHVMRTSVSFRRKVENVLAKPSPYGDAVYIQGSLSGWTQGLVALMHSMHPNFPQADYDAHHYVAACRQASIGMDKQADGRWAPPKALQFDLAAFLPTAAASPTAAARQPALAA